MRRGITIWEILISIAVLMLLGLGIFFGGPKYVVWARDAKKKADLYKLSSNLEDYFNDHKNYPTDLSGCGRDWHCDIESYSDYYYEVNEERSWFKLYANLERSDDASIKKVDCSYGCGPECRYNYGVSSPNIRIDRCPGPPTYACSPGSQAKCEEYDDPESSRCPTTWLESDCRGQCIYKGMRCQNASGKTINKETL